MKVDCPSQEIDILDRLIRKYQFTIDHELKDNKREGARRRNLVKEKSRMEKKRRIIKNSIRNELKGMLNEYK